MPQEKNDRFSPSTGSTGIQVDAITGILCIQRGSVAPDTTVRGVSHQENQGLLDILVVTRVSANRSSPTLTALCATPQSLSRDTPYCNHSGSPCTIAAVFSTSTSPYGDDTATPTVPRRDFAESDLDTPSSWPECYHQRSWAYQPATIPPTPAATLRIEGLERAIVVHCSSEALTVADVLLAVDRATEGWAVRCRSFEGLQWGGLYESPEEVEVWLVDFRGRWRSYRGSGWP